MGSELLRVPGRGEGWKEELDGLEFFRLVLLISEIR